MCCSEWKLCRDNNILCMQVYNVSKLSVLDAIACKYAQGNSLKLGYISYSSCSVKRKFIMSEMTLMSVVHEIFLIFFHCKTKHSSEKKVTGTSISSAGNHLSLNPES